MSTSVEQMTHELPKTDDLSKHDLKPIDRSSSKQHVAGHQQTTQQEKNQHPLHQYDLSIMKKFYESCVGKFSEQNPRFKPTEWANLNPMPAHLTQQERNDWPNPLVISQKQRVYEAFAKLSRESGEPMILMPNFDYGDISNFERFLQAIKQDGVNAIGKYKQYLNNKDMRKFEVDLVVMHPRYGIMLFEVKECDNWDSKRRSRARSQLHSARGCFESMGRLIAECHGWTNSEAHVQVTEFVALPNVQERPYNNSQSPNQSLLQTPGGNQNHSGSSTASATGRSQRNQLHYLIKQDLENSVEFSKWWTKYVVEPKVQYQQALEAENKTNKFDLQALNCMVGLINAIRNNSIMPVVYPEFEVSHSAEEQDKTENSQTDRPENQPEEPKQADGEQKPPKDTETQQDKANERQTPKETQFQPALNVHGEFFQAEHESVRSLSKVVVTSKDSEKLRKAVCLQTMWFLLNDSQKKVSVVCSEMNKPYYEEFFSRQRKLYNNLNNVRFYADLHSCAVEAQHTLRKDGEIWFFDNGISGKLSEVIERVKELNAFWVFTTEEETINQHREELESVNTRCVCFDAENKHRENETMMPWLTGTTIKFPLRLQCDLLIVGDLIGLNQLKPLYRYLKNNYATNHSSHYQSQNDNSHSNSRHSNYYQQPQQQHLAFNPSKKFRSVKFIRGGSIENLKNSLKMHDSVQAQVVLMHIGDEDLFKRSTSSTVERVKEMATLVKEYCPKSFVVLSTLMRRMSRTENTASHEVNKGIVNFCKQTRDSLNCYYMLNNHFEPDNHTQEGRNLNNKGLRLYVDNLLFMVDYFLVRNNKQH